MNRDVTSITLCSNVDVDVSLADIVEKEFDSSDTSHQPMRIAPDENEDDRNSERRYHNRDFEFVVSNDLRDASDNSFNGQRENFANLYISGPPTENDDVIYGQVPGRKQLTGGRFAVDERDHFTGDDRHCQSN